MSHVATNNWLTSTCYIERAINKDDKFTFIYVILCWYISRHLTHTCTYLLVIHVLSKNVGKYMDIQSYVLFVLPNRLKRYLQNNI